MGTLKNDFYQLIKTNDRLLNFIIDSPPKGFWYCNLEDIQQIWTNPECKQTLGYDVSDKITKRESIIQEDELQKLIENLDGKDFDPAAQYHVSYRHFDGSVLQTICTGLITENKDGNPSGLFIAIKQAIPAHGRRRVKQLNKPIDLAQEFQYLNERFRISEERFQRAFENAAIGMAIVSLKGKWLRINNSLSEILGYTSSELIKLAFQDITHPDDLDKDLNLVNEALEGKRESYQMEKRYFHKNGQIVWAILAVSIVKDSYGKPLHFISQITDISKIKEAEIEVKSVLAVTNDQNRRLLNFAHIVSHNLRSHSGNLTMLLSFIETDTDEHSRNELFKMFRHAATNLQETVGHLNEVVAVNTTTHENLTEVNLGKAINGAIGSIEALLKAERVKCINEVEKNIIISAVPAYLDSILLNFLTNSIKYHAKERKPVIKLSAETKDNLVILSIQDNGLGIDLNLNRDKMFGMYKTFHGNKDARGIGLFITKNQIEAMGGKVYVESEVDKGTTFKIHFKRR
ncbi:sensor histidine kinase [Pedobacter nyackensis]|uniref:histidine kinase n=1 Tax=Pedobacter nyackensis TaxID=475255 RepID=A0A1W1ZUM5_9SPHI|nr:HAMP domain-containing sensor histidine kinase [Pedobacter nyackensis]SMC52185.1 PAS domain S-box-containing protein [Pedobacter nyackensis]